MRRPGQTYSMLPTSPHICRFSRKRGYLQVFCFEVHDFTMVDLCTVTNVSSTIGCLSQLVIRSVHSGGIEGSVSNIIVSIYVGINI